MSSANAAAVVAARPFLISSIMGIREEKEHSHSAAVMAAAAAAAESTMAAMNEEYIKRMQRHAAGKPTSFQGPFFNDVTQLGVRVNLFLKSRY